MRLVPISEVLDGTVIGRDVLAGRDRAPLLRAGIKLSSDYRDGLVRAGVRAVYVEDESSEGITPLKPILSEETQERAAQAVADTYAEAQTALEANRALDPAVSERLDSTLQLMLGEVKSHGDAAVALRDMCAADAYTFQHSIDVTALGMLLGAHVFVAQGWSAEASPGSRSQVDERLLVLGMGLLLHDIGKLVIPDSILRKRGRLTRPERMLIECHPQAGFDLLSAGDWSPLVKAIVLRHHERWDGSGYPDGLRGKEIHPMARLAAVADVFDAVTSERPYAAARPAHEGLRIVEAGSGTQFDPELVKVILRVVAPFPPGVEIQLDDGRRGIVVDVPSETTDRPLVRIIDGPGAPYEIALVDVPELGVVGWTSESPRARLVLPY